MIVIAIAAGGALGSVLRYLAGLALPPLAGLPVATLLVNVSGSFVLGLLYGALDQTGTSPALRAFAGIGFCGGFTTFSAFSLETVRLMQEGETLMAGSYALATVVLSLLATFGGIGLSAAFRHG